MISVATLEAFLDNIGTPPLVDVRSESEYAKGHIPGSINIPLLDDKARKEVGTLYKQMGREAAVMKGFQLVGPRFYNLFKQVRQKAADKQVYFYCWRGGLRSQIMSWMMDLADYEVTLLKGGYKAYRNYVHSLFEKSWSWIIVSGKTGVGKTALLRQLALRGEQVLDLEALANHKGSAFGHIGLPAQPTVEHFENLIGWQLRQFDAAKPVWIENESRFIGQARIPDTLFNQSLDKPVIELVAEDAARRQMIWAEYGQQPLDQLLAATQKLERRLGGDRMKSACDALESGNWQAWLDVLLPYYDKTYAHSSGIRTGQVYPLTLTLEIENDLQAMLAIKDQIWKR
jgi:tRNA 2-selenouridine synthase